MLDPNQKVLKSDRKTLDGFIEINTHLQGEYSLVLSNVKDKKHSKVVSIATKVINVKDSETEVKNSDEQHMRNMEHRVI